MLMRHPCLSPGNHPCGTAALGGVFCFCGTGTPAGGFCFSLKLLVATFLPLALLVINGLIKLTSLRWPSPQRRQARLKIARYAKRLSGLPAQALKCRVRVNDKNRVPPGTAEVTINRLCPTTRTPRCCFIVYLRPRTESRAFLKSCNPGSGRTWAELRGPTA